jgi:hypothetical protein
LRIEFDPLLRWIRDIVNDIAFLVMDFASHERPELAFALLSRYLEVTGDYDGIQLLPFYAVYRALVRAKVDAISAEQVPSRGAEFGERLRRRIEAATAWTSPRQPRLMRGMASGSGKSWPSQRLSRCAASDSVGSGTQAPRRHCPEQSAAARRRNYAASSAITWGRPIAPRCARCRHQRIVDAAFLDA